MQMIIKAQVIIACNASYVPVPCYCYNVSAACACLLSFFIVNSVADALQCREDHMLGFLQGFKASDQATRSTCPHQFLQHWCWPLVKPTLSHLCWPFSPLNMQNVPRWHLSQFFGCQCVVDDSLPSLDGKVLAEKKENSVVQAGRITVASNPGFLFRILSRSSFGEKSEGKPGRISHMIQWQCHHSSTL